MKLIVGIVIDNMTQRRCMPIESVKSGDDYSNFVHNIRVGHMLIQIKSIRHTWLVKIM